MELHLKIIGTLLIALAIMHVIFPRYFNWEKELQTVSLINKQLMYVHTFFIAFTVLLMGIILIYATQDILHTRLGRLLALGLFVFWCLRLIFQFFVYSTKLWKGKRFETVIHIVFTLLWTYFSLIFFLIYYQEG